MRGIDDSQKLQPLALGYADSHIPQNIFLNLSRGRLWQSAYKFKDAWDFEMRQHAACELSQLIRRGE